MLKGRLQPGRMFLVDTAQGRIIADEEIKHDLRGQQPYGEWLRAHLIDDRETCPSRRTCRSRITRRCCERQQAFGYTHEDLRMLLGPMATGGEEPMGSMGTDTPLAVLSDAPRLLYDYFKQLFAQVTNPPLDAHPRGDGHPDRDQHRAGGQPARAGARGRAARSSSRPRS